MVLPANCHRKMHLKFCHRILLYEREIVFGCHAIPPAIAHCLFCCPAKGQKQVMYVEISTDQGQALRLLTLISVFFHPGEKNHSSSSLIFHGNSPISPSLRSALWFLPDYHIPLLPKWSPALSQFSVVIALFPHWVQGKNSSLLEQCLCDEWQSLLMKKK